MASSINFREAALIHPLYRSGTNITIGMLETKPMPKPADQVPSALQIMHLSKLLSQKGSFFL